MLYQWSGWKRDDDGFQMIWYGRTDGVYISGYYELRRGTQGYTEWFTHPQNYKLIGRADTLQQAKADVAEYAKRHP